MLTHTCGFHAFATTTNAGFGGAGVGCTGAAVGTGAGGATASVVAGMTADGSLTAVSAAGAAGRGRSPDAASAMPATFVAPLVSLAAARRPWCRASQTPVPVRLATSTTPAAQSCHGKP